jgi:hypothetical protein
MGIVWTLRARGLAPSLGAGGSLIVAALCCLLFATALVTFRDWPGRDEALPGGTVTMTPPAAKVAGRVASGPAAPAAATPVAAAPARERTRATRPARRGGTRRGSAVPPAPGGTSPPAATVPAPSTAPAAQPAAQPGPAAPAPAPARPEPRPAPGTVETIVKTGRDVVPPLPPVVDEPIRPVLDTLQSAGRTVDETAGTLLPSLP